MIEREFIRNKIKNLNIRARIQETLKKTAGCGGIYVEKTPLGEKITIHTVRPGLVIGRGGETIKKLTNLLKSYYKLDNPQIEVIEITEPFLNPYTVAKRIADDLERFGPSRFKSIGYRALGNIMRSGAMGAEIIIAGRGVPSSRSRSWRFYKGYMKKSGDVSAELPTAIERANLRTGAVGVKVRIMPPNMKLPDKINIYSDTVVEEIEEVPKKGEAKPEEAKAETEKQETPKETAKPKDLSDKSKGIAKKPATKKTKVKVTKKKPTEKKAPAKKKASQTSKKPAEPTALEAKK